ncbi:MAG: hypothetical protein AAGJ08_24700 [Cyanobacteria bacterium P01_H01_bin.35]
MHGFVAEVRDSDIPIDCIGSAIRLIFLLYSTQNPNIHDHQAAQNQVLFPNLKRYLPLSVNAFIPPSARQVVTLKVV